VALVAALLLLAAGAEAQAPKWAEHNVVVGQLVSLNPDPYTALKSFVIKKSPKIEMKFAVAEGVRVPKGLKTGDVVSVSYRVDQSGIFWADSVKKGAAGNRVTGRSLPGALARPRSPGPRASCCSRP
jgi:hypothetical protein